MVVSAQCLFLTMPWVGLRYVIGVFSGHTYFFLEIQSVIGEHLSNQEGYAACSCHYKIYNNPITQSKPPDHINTLVTGICKSHLGIKYSEEVSWKSNQMLKGITVDSQQIFIKIP